MINKKTFLNTIIVIVFSGVSSLSVFLMNIIISRSYSVEDYGSFTAAFNLINLFSVFLGFGVGQYWIKKFGEKGIYAYEFVRYSIYISIISFVAGGIIYLALLRFGSFPDLTKNLLLFFISSIILQGTISMVAPLYVIERRFFKSSLVNFSMQFIKLLTALIIVIMALDLIYFGLIISIFNVLILFMVIRKFRSLKKRNLELPAIKYEEVETSETSFKSVLIEVWPFGVIGIMFYIYYQSDIILLSIMGPISEVGYYNVAFTIISALYLIPKIVFQKVLNVDIQLWYTYDRDRIFNTLRNTQIIMALISVSVFIILFITSENIIIIMFGERYLDASIVLKILSVGLLFRFMYALPATIMNTANNIYFKVQLQIITSVVNIGLNLILIPYIGFIGAAVSTVFCELILLIFFNKKLTELIRENQAVTGN